MGVVVFFEVTIIAEMFFVRSPHLVPPYHSLLFSYSLRCHVKGRGQVACLFDTVSSATNCALT